MPRKPGQWWNWSGRPVDRVLRDRTADELVAELRQMQKDAAHTEGEHDGLTVGRKTGDTFIQAELDLLEGTITVTDYQIRRRKVIEPEKSDG